MSCTNRFAAAAALVGLLGVSSLTVPAAAQTTATASISALASVLGIAPLTAAGVNDLNFGVATAGTPKTPGSLAADAGRFNVSGEPLTPVSVSFTLPTVLTGAGSATIPITFGTTDGLLWAPYPGTFTTFNPNAPTFPSTNAIGGLTIGISGTVSPPLGSTTGSYTGTITLTVAYL
jgi:hypothetical protein